MSTGRFSGRVAFVTGASSGIGRATAVAFAAEGADVVITGIDEEGNAETERQAAAHDGGVLSMRCDVTRSEDIAATLGRAIESFGRLDFAFNNAGIEQPPKRSGPRFRSSQSSPAMPPATMVWKRQPAGVRSSRSP